MDIGFSSFVLLMLAFAPNPTFILSSPTSPFSSSPSAQPQQPTSPSDMYGCWGGCYNTCYVRNGQTDASKLPCSVGCMNDCNPMLSTSSSFGDGVGGPAGFGFCRLGCTLSSCAGLIYDRNLLQDCLNRCVEGCM